MGDVASVENDNDATKMWHMRLGHLSACGIIELHKRNLLRGVSSCQLNCASIMFLRNNVEFASRLGNTRLRES